MTSDALVVPINLAALVITREESGNRDTTKLLADVAADFSQLPWATEDRQSGGQEVPYIVTDAVRSHPFTAVTGRPEAGIHLHWSLPPAITRGVAHQHQTKVEFPHVPNRWLVVRFASFSDADPSLLAWVVESDHLWPGSTHPDDPSVTARAVPVSPADGKKSYAPGEKTFQTLGRVFALSDWQGPAGTDYAPRLTAMGYGTTEYAAAYPHCPSVFGFLDPAKDLDDLDSTPTGIGFLVVGWYADHAHDPLSSPDFQQGTPADRRQAIADSLGWTTTLPPESPEVPARTILSAAIFGVPWDGQPRFVSQQNEGLSFAIGNTTAEAVSALLVQGDDDMEKTINEFQLGLLTRQGTSQPPDPDFEDEVEEAAQAAGFAARAAGGTWTLRRPRDAAATGDPTLRSAAAADPPAGLSSLLDALNQAQTRLNGLRHDLATQRRQLFADWYRYMRLQYYGFNKPTDKVGAREVHDLIEKHVCNDIDGAVQAVADQVTATRQTKAALHNALKKDAGGWVAELVAAPPYREPHDPVLLVSGKDLHPHERYQPTGPPTCRMGDSISTVLTVTDGSGSVSAADLPTLPPSEAPLPPEHAALLTEALLLDPNQLAALATIATSHGAQGDVAAAISDAQQAVAGGGPLGSAVSFNHLLPDPLAVTVWDPPWIPLLLEWHVDIKAVVVPGPARAFDPKTLQTYFVADPDSLDLSLKGPVPTKHDVSCTGSVVLAGRTDINLQTQLQNFLAVWPDDDDPLVKRQTLETLVSHLDAHAMAQALNGFNATLLNRSHILQIPVTDPLAATNAAKVKVPPSFSDHDVRSRVAGHNDSAPEVEMQIGTGAVPFVPLRAGLATVAKVRVVDAFGQIREYTAPTVHVASSLRRGAPPNRLLLPPRLTQPARLLLRWLDATEDTVESNTTLESSPVCGWVLYNHLDDDLAVYDAAGNALGSIGSSSDSSPATWTGAPGTPHYGLTTDEAITNPHLRSLVDAVCGQAASAYLEPLLDTIDLALTTVNPLGFDQDQPLSQLMGRPLAVVRAGLRLELEGKPAADQSWEALAATVKSPSTPRPDGGVTGLEVPITIGAPGKLGDGVVGYVVETGKSDAYDTFYAPATDSSSPHVVKAESPVFSLTPQPSSQPGLADQMLTMLVDPRGSVHALSGILPVVTASVAPAHYRAALGQIAVTFLTTPVLVPGGDLPASGAPAPAFPVPPEAGYSWSWLRHDPGDADTWSDQTVTQPATAHAAMTSPQHIEEGWLRLAPEAKS